MADASKLKLPHRAEHIGSLLRPRELRDAFKAHAAGQMNDAAYREVEDRNIVEAIRMQEETGLATISDGEFRRGSWAFGLVKAVEGFGEARSMFEFHDAAGNSYPFDTCYAVSKIRRSRPIAVGEFEFVRRHTERVPKVTMPAPSFMHFFRGKACADPAVYPDVAGFWADLLRVYHEELAELGRAGARYLQIDEVPLAMLCDPAVRERARAIGEDPDALITMYINAVNDVLSARPPGMTVGMHLCRGNLRSRWMAAGSYEAVAERLFNEVKVDAFFLEYDTPRAGDFAPLRFMAKDKTVVLGLVSTKTPVLEDTEALRRRIDEAARHVPLERLALSPQCGFASTVGGNLLSIDDEWRKLRLVVEVAKRVWGKE
ncbi:MAG: 5-methyltetrahydropteroyltriglutamate--homocysteine S-methyltransferase [Candidatus Binataceae bacterium]